MSVVLFGIQDAEAAGKRRRSSKANAVPAVRTLTIVGTATVGVKPTPMLVLWHDQVNSSAILPDVYAASANEVKNVRLLERVNAKLSTKSIPSEGLKVVLTCPSYLPITAGNSKSYYITGVYSIVGHTMPECSIISVTASNGVVFNP